ncbi:MAG: AMP-binding protein [Bacteroidales bacterium]
MKRGQKIWRVGKPIEGVTVKIAKDEEILVKGPNVMQGYYKDPEMTKEAIGQEGWFHTGSAAGLSRKGF